MADRPENPEVRWKQKFSRYKKVLDQLAEFLQLGKLSKFEEQGLIKAFEYTYELAWNTLKDFYESQGESNIQGSKDAIRLAFKRGLIQDGEVWMSMVQSRIQTAHTYNEETAREVVTAITQKYVQQFEGLKTTLETLA
jgi:nucleotidyltransferase substrate binding protein (TIGR01987 family)